MKRKIRFCSILPFLFFLLYLYTGCQGEKEDDGQIPGYVVADDLFTELSSESQEKLVSLSNDMKRGIDPGFENLSGIFPEMKYSKTLTGVKEHMGKYLVTWDGAVVCSPLHISLSVGNGLSPFGMVSEEDVSRSLMDGYLPVVTTNYKYDGLDYEETVFGYSEGFSTAKEQVAFIRIKVTNSTAEDKDTKLSVNINQIEGSNDFPYKCSLAIKNNGVVNENGDVIFYADQGGGKLEGNILIYDFSLEGGKSGEFYFRFPHRPVSSDNMNILEEPSFDEAVAMLKDFWEGVIERGMEVEVPEEIINHAYKTWLINNFLLAEEENGYFEVHDAPFFYEHVYGFAASMYMNTLITRGYFEEAKKCADLFIRLQRPNGAFSQIRNNSIIPHQNGSMLYTISQLYRVSGDDEWFKRVVPHVLDACNWIIDDRTKNKILTDGERPVTYGLLSEYRYCNDPMSEWTNAREYLGNAWCWKGMNEASRALAELGGEYEQESERLRKEADEYRNDIFISMEKAAMKENDLVFLPLVVNNTTFFSNLQENTLSYFYNILSPRMIESEIFDIDDEKIHWVPKFLEQKGGLILGLARWKGFGGIDPHFIAGYAINNLRLNETDKFLLSFYGLITYGMSMNTWSTNEHWYITSGTSNYGGLDERHWASARQPHLHSTSEMIRLTNMMLVKEERDEVWIAYGVPRKWLEDGKEIKVEKAQTCFGPVGYKIESHVSDGFLKTELSASVTKQPSAIRLKLRHPEQKKIKKVEVNGDKWKDFDGEIINLDPSGGDITIFTYY